MVELRRAARSCSTTGVMTDGRVAACCACLLDIEDRGVVSVLGLACYSSVSPW